MIENAVIYEDIHKELVEAFNSTNCTSSDWEKEEYKDLKTHIKNHYKDEQNFTCCYCHQKIKVDHNATWDIEHIIPRSLKPTFMFEPQNLCISCKDCNVSKHATNVLKNQNLKKFPTKADQYLIVHPHFHKYEEHIEIVVEGDLYRPLSDEGQFTIITCGLLRFWKYLDKKNMQKTDPLSRSYGKKLAFSETKEEQEEAEKELLQILKLKYPNK